MQLVGLSTGVGLYEREGLAPGASRDETVMFQGGSGSYPVSWKGNDGSFSSASGTCRSAAAPRRSPCTSGRSPRGSIPRSSRSTTRARPASTSRRSPPSWRRRRSTPRTRTRSSRAATVDRADKKSYFVTVAPGTSVLKLDNVVGDGRTRLDVIDPWGDPYLLPLPCSCALDYATGPAPTSLGIPNPMAGVWEVDVEASRSAAATRARRRSPPRCSASTRRPRPGRSAGTAPRRRRSRSRTGSPRSPAARSAPCSGAHRWRGRRSTRTTSR